MANEARQVIKKGDAINYTILDATAVAKGALCNAYGSRSTSGAQAATVLASQWGGVCGREKIASDGRTHVPLFRDGVFRMTLASGSAGITIGEHVIVSGANLIAVATEAQIAAGQSCGIALETKTAGQTCEVDVGK